VHTAAPLDTDCEIPILDLGNLGGGGLSERAGWI
jgi:hypothetical protein